MRRQNYKYKWARSLRIQNGLGRKQRKKEIQIVQKQWSSQLKVNYLKTAS